MPTTISREDARQETYDNYAVFVKEMLPDLLETHPNGWALLRERQLIGVYRHSCQSSGPRHVPRSSVPHPGNH